MRSVTRVVVVLSLVAVGLTVLSSSASAGADEPVTHVVTTTKDVDDPTDGKCSLREAVIASHGSSGGPGAGRGECPGGSGDLDTIKLKPDTTYKLTLDGDVDEDDNVDGDLDILFGTVKILGGRGTVIEQRDKDQRVLDILGGVVIVERVTITGGRADAGPVLDGGGIFNDGTLTIRRSAVIRNRAGTGSVFTDDPGGNGGGIYNIGTLVVEQSKIANNSAGTGGGDNVGPTPATTRGGWGGGILSSGDLAVNDSKVMNNRAGDGGRGGNGNEAFGSREGADGGPGGGIATTTGTLAIVRSTVAGNRAGNGGDGGDGGDWTSDPGGDASPGGHGGHGGGIYRISAQLMNVTDTTISRNRAGTGGMGGDGGEGTPPGFSAADGVRGSAGGILLGSPLTMRNSTISSNSARDGGGIFANADALLNNATIARNVASESGGGAYISGGTFTVHNSILADNKADSFVECTGAIVGNSNNLVEKPDGCGGVSGTDITGVDPKLGPLDTNGGPTKTHALKRGSPAINEGYPGPATGTVPACEVNDQRGKPRSACDIGAYEKV